MKNGKDLLDILFDTAVHFAMMDSWQWVDKSKQERSRQWVDREFKRRLEESSEIVVGEWVLQPEKLYHRVCGQWITIDRRMQHKCDLPSSPDDKTKLDG